MRALCLTSLMVVVLGGTALGAAFNYRDRVANDALVGRPQTLKFEFYAKAEGGKSLFTTNLTVNVASNGVFCAEVGVPSGENASLFATTNERFVAVMVPTVNGGVPNELLHGVRRKLMPVPTALYAQGASEARGDFTVRGNADIRGGIEFFGDGQTHSVDSDGRLSLRDFDVDRFASDDGSLGGSLSVGKDLMLTKSLSMGGQSFTGSNATLVAHSVSVNSFVMPGMSDSLIPKGMIMMWFGDANKVPAGWVLCDGGNGTPDLTGRFVVGAARSGDDWNAYQKTGGSRSVTLNLTQIPKHDHDYFGDDQLVTHAEKSYDHSGYDATSSKSGDSAWFRTGETGGGNSHENRPPFKALYYIMKVK